jgi:hypothetical protein
MDAGLSLARQARAFHRHELRTLTYVTIDQGNGGIVRNLNRDGIGVQMVAAVRPRQQLRVRFVLPYSKLRVEARGEVTWATFSGQCGIRFLDLSPRMRRQIDEWIFGNLLEGADPVADRRSAFNGSATGTAQARPLELRPRGFSFAPPPYDGAEVASEEDDGLALPAAPLKIIELPPHPESDLDTEDAPAAGVRQLDWLSQPLSNNGLVWTVNSLVIVASLLLFSLVFLVVTGEIPKWPLGMTAGAAIFVAALYWGFFKLFGGTSAGKRLLKLAGYDRENEEEFVARFR